ncbi:group-specific protein [Paenibacillus sp. FSL R5-0887]|jgi:hypothetical protein|uniref:group-specific protein n=1 Tax=unclassified Paenibacillus TaxID=185978 RepID=UPI0030EF0D48
MSDGKNLVTIDIDKSEILLICREKIEKLLDELDNKYVFWDTTEPEKRTCMSWNSIQFKIHFSLTIDFQNIKSEMV